MLWYSTGLVQDFDYVKNFGQGEIRNDKYGALQSPYYWVTGAKKILQSGINDIYVKSTFHVDYDGDMPIKTNNDGTCFNFDDIIYVRYQKNGNENCINVYWYAKEIASYVIHQDSFFKLEAHLQCSSSKGNITIFLNDAEIINTSLVCNNELKYIIFGDKYTNDTYNLI
jgi:hypothetical protein